MHSTVRFIVIMTLITLGFLVLMFVDTPKSYLAPEWRSVIAPPTLPTRVPERIAREETRGAIRIDREQRGLTQKTSPLSEREFRRIFAQSDWPKEYYGAVYRIVFCESAFIPNAIGEKGDYGLMQVNYALHKNKVAEPRKLLDPLTNLNVAYRIHREADWGGHTGFIPWLPSNACHGLVPRTMAMR